ncbi:unnamed protein product [Trichobilharzia szidati]|nr:unnamed protein product [Trichobilharzia szidati]
MLCSEGFSDETLSVCLLFPEQIVLQEGLLFAATENNPVAYIGFWPHYMGIWNHSLTLDNLFHYSDCYLQGRNNLFLGCFEGSACQVFRSCTFVDSFRACT